MMDVQAMSHELAKSSLTDRLSKLLTDEFLKLPPGEKLPSGQDLAKRFGVSLTVVREAISTLKADGLVETRQGSGAFVSRTMRQRPFRIASGGGTGSAALVGEAGPEQIFELRTGVEMQAAALAAQRGTAAQHRAVRKAFNNMQAALAAGDDGVDADMLFHRRIAEAAGNVLFGSFLDFLSEHIRESIAGSRRDMHVWHAQQQKVMQEHAAMVEGICSRDADRARDAAYQHMMNCLERCSHN